MARPVRPLLALVLVVLLAVPAGLRPSPAAALSCGPCPAVATDQVNLRAGPSLDAAILGVIPAGAELQWNIEPAPVDGYVPVIYGESAGWAHEDYLLLYPASATTLTAVNLRQEPGLGAPVVGVLPDGASLTLLGGPRSADGHDWYQTYYQEFTPGSSSSGWVAGDYLDLDLR